MTDKYITYKLDGRTFDVPESDAASIEKKYPSATIEMRMGERVFDVPVSDKSNILKKYPNVSYVFESENKQEEETTKPSFMPIEEEPEKSYASASMADLSIAEEDNSNRIADILRDPNLSRREKRQAKRAARSAGEMPTWGETAAKATGSALATTGKMVVDATNEGGKMGRKRAIANNPLTGIAATIEAITGKSVLDEDNPLNDISENLGETAERWSHEADPTGGEMSFGELLKSGHIGLAMQKGLGSTIESAPMMLATKNPYVAGLYMAGMAASNYADESRENPDIPEWKRAINSVGSAAFELAVEKLIDIPWKYFKNAGGEITEDIVQEVLERAAEEGTQTIAKRIKRIIGNTAKDAVGEGFEEVVTSLGNDALGSALDAIDGNKDYGFKAQWEEFKEQNPDATVDDFANAKGREYVESFLGGALSSVYISGLANVVKEHQDAGKVREFNKAYVEGASLDYEDMYDTNDDVNDAIDNAVSASVNAKGETTLTREFVENLSAEEALALSRSEDVNKRQQAAFEKLAKQKATQNGLTGKLDDRVASSISRITNVVEQASENGTITCGAYGDKIVFVKGGVVNADGTVSLPNGQNGPVIVIDGGKKYTVDSSEITEAWSTGADGYLQNAESSIRDRDAFLREEYINIVGPRAKAKAVKQYLNTKILINTEEGGMAQVEVQAILPNGEVLVKGKKGDLGGQSERLFGPSAFYDAIARNEDGSPVFVESISQQQSTQTPAENTQTQAQPQQTATPSEPQDFRDSEQTILINGIPTIVEVTNQDDAADRVTYTYTDENGQEKTGTATVSGFAAAIKQAEAETTVEIPEDQLSQQNPADGTSDTSDNGDSEIYVKPRKDEDEEASPTATTDTEQIQVEPQNINWDALFENDADAYFAEMQNQFGDKTAKRLGAVVAATQKKLDALNKATPETDNEIFENEEKKEKLEAKIEALNGMIARLSAEPIAETEDIGDLPLATGETVRGGEGSNSVLQEAQPIQTRGEGAVDEESEGVNEGINREDADSPVYSGEPSVSEGVYPESESVSSLDEDMPDFTGESEQTPVAPNQVANPVAEAQKIEEHLTAQLVRDLSKEQKQDLAKSLGKKVADLFATREAYDEYQETATDFGAYNSYFDEGVENSFANRGNQYQISDDNLGVNSAAQQLTVDALMESLDGYIDIEVVSDEQVVKMLESSEPIELMGTRVNNRRNAIAQYFSGKQLSMIEQSIINAFANGAKNESIIITRNGTNKRIHLKQGSEPKAGVSHSILKHYDTASNNYTDSEILLIPNIIQNGTEVKNGKKISYKHTSNGVTYTVTTEIHDREENFTNFFTDRKPTTGNSSNTVKQHVHPQQSFSTANVSNNSITTNTGQNKNSLLRTIDGTVYGWTDGKKIYLTKAGINPNTPIHEYTHIWAKAMMKKNPKGWNSIKKLLKGTPIWNEVVNDPNYSNIKNDEDAIASEALSRISGSTNAAKMEQMAQKMIDEANGTARKLEARGLIQNMKDALTKFWSWVGKNIFEIENFKNIDEVTDRVLYDLLNKTDLGTLSEGQVETQIVTDPQVIEELEASPKIAGFRNVVQNEDGTFSSPMAYWLQSTKEGAKSRVETAKFELGKWEEAEEHPELVDENGKITLVKPNKGTVDGVAYDPYIHNRLEPVNLQFKDAWKRDDLVYVETEVAETDLNDGYHADKALLPVGVHSWSNGDVMLSRYDKPVRVMPWEEVADAWVKRLNGEGVHFDVVPPAMRSLLVERGVEILPPHKGMGKKCNDAYAEWKKENEILSRKGENNTKFVEQFEFKQNNEQRELEYSDEFRRLQEESARMSGQLVSEKDGVQQTTIRELVGRIGGTLQRELDRARSGRGYKLRTLVNDSKGTSFDIIENVDGRLFHDIFEIVRTYLPNGELVDLHDNYNDAICYITSDGLAGFAVDTKGNLISVFSLYGNSKKGFLGAIKDLITEAGATHLDGYNSPKQPLAKIYSKVFGWKVASMMDYNMEYDHDNIAENHEMPQVAFMVNTDADIETKHFDKDQYDEAVAYQQEQVEVSNRVDTQNAAVDYLAGPQRNVVIERVVNDEAAKLGVKVTYKTREEMPAGHKNDKGYYNPQTGEIVVCTENATSIADAIKTILHEAVAHKGLRKLFGNRFDEFIRNVYDLLDAETKAKVDARAAAHYNGDTALAMEEYMASLAENENFADQTIWDKIKSIFTNLINDILGRNDIKIGDNELRYILRASYNNMVNPRSMDTIEGWAKDQLMREEYKVNESTPEILSRTGIDPTEVASETARQVYDKTVNETWQEFQRQFQDAYQPVRIAIDAIQQETGNVPIEDYENFLLIQNQMSSRSRVEIDKFQRRYYSPIISQVNAIIDTLLAARGFNVKDKAKRAEVYKEVINYLIAKHGIERNKYYQSTKTRKMTAKEMKPELDEAQADYQQKVDMINMNNNLSDAERELQLRDALDEYNAVVQEIKSREIPDMRDYSGLTSLFGLDSKEYEEAERMAQEMVDNFEKSLGRVDNEDGEIVEQSEAIDKMWEKINKATDKTLRHSYESGLLSRQQYNDIKAMFKFYIPLRGFDETTAEDVYSYARFEGNRFNPAVQTAKGRTSVADDPIAIIMNMAESEIAQGNKNRAKQALYNYLLNRTIMGEDGKEQQNSLMQVEDVWYVKGVDSEGNEIYQIAIPDRSRGESWEEFEMRMQTMAEEGNAYKSKKGKLDVGMRFQKQRNQGAHYVYLKVNGVEKAIYINGDPKAADAINGTYRPEPIYKKGSVKTKNEKVNKVIEFVEDNLNLANLNRLISSTFTNYSLEFTARNYFRDMIYSHINIGIKESDPAYRKKFRQNWRHNNLRTVKNMLQAYKNGEYEGRPLTEDEAAFVEFMENGGQTGYTLINSVESRKRDLERAIKNMQNGSEGGGVKDTKAFKATLGAIELLNESSELVTRFAAFKTSRDMGRSINKSISDAKEITVNFNTKGAQDGKGLAGFIARYFGWSKYFFNASVQGVQNIKAMAEANKLKFCSAVGGIAGLGFCMPIIAGALSELFGGDDDDENAYWNIPEYDRQNNLCIPVGNTYLKIPLPIGFREVYAIGDMVAAMAFDKKFTRDVSQVGMDIANKIASTVLPINPLESSANGLNFWHTFLYTALPSSAQFAIQNATNLDWKGVPLQKEYTYNEDDPQWMKAYASNPDWMVTVAKWCNENTQFGDYEGWDWSPEKLDNTLSNMFGGIYTIVKKTGKTISMAWNEENRTTSNIPLAGVVLGSGIGSDDMYMTDAYYDMLEYYDSNVNLIKRRAKQFGFDLDDVFVRKKGAHQPKMQEIYSNPTFEWMQEWYKGNKELEKYDDNVKKLEKKIAESDKPSETNIRRLNRARLQFEQERREFINDMLELD